MSAAATPALSASLLAVLLVRTWPTHPGLDVDASAVLQEKFYDVLVPEEMSLIS
jgi:hypothetical protein